MEARRAINVQARGLAKLSQQAAAVGDKQAARQLAEEALRRDPQNEVAERLTRVAQFDEPAGELPPAIPPAGEAPPPAAGEEDLRLVRPAPRAAAQPADDLGFLESIEQRRELLIQSLVRDVNLGLQQARDMMSTNPEVAETDLKLLLDRVSRTPELTPGVRQQLRNQLENAIIVANRARADLEAKLVEQAERLRAAEEQRLMLERLVSREQRVKQLIERMNGLLSERRYQDAEIDAARVAYALDPLPNDIECRAVLARGGLRRREHANPRPAP
jgi:hypothetical protein